MLLEQEFKGTTGETNDCCLRGEEEIESEGTTGCCAEVILEPVQIAEELTVDVRLSADKSPLAAGGIDVGARFGGGFIVIIDLNPGFGCAAPTAFILQGHIGRIESMNAEASTEDWKDNWNRLKI